MSKKCILFIILISISLFSFCAVAQTQCTEDSECTADEYCIDNICTIVIDSEIKNILSLQDDGLTSVAVKQEITGTPTSFTDIHEEYLPEGITLDDVYLAQEEGKIEVRTSMKFFEVSSPQMQGEFTLVKKEIASQIAEYVVIEQVPEELAISSEMIASANREFKTENIFTFAGSKDSVFYYIIEGNAVSYISQFQTVVVPATPVKIKGNIYRDAVCGDRICTSPLEDKITCPQDCTKKISWFFIIILVILFIALVFFANKLRKRKKFAPPNPPFRSIDEERKLRNYISSALSSGKSKDEIRNILLTKGWTEKQINYIFHMHY